VTARSRSERIADPREAFGHPEALPPHPQGQRAGHLHHPQTSPQNEHHRPPVPTDGDPRHPQGRKRRSSATRRVSSRPQECAAGAAPAEGRPTPAAASDGRRGGDAVVPAPGALRPLARALLWVAADVHAARRDPLGQDRQASSPDLRMPTDRVRLPSRMGLRSGLVSPATPGRTTSGDASSHVRATTPPPVKNSDCLGGFA
jgi:hypothetical protein